MRYEDFKNTVGGSVENLRDEWEFEYPVAELAKAALEQLEYHKGRIEVWRAKRQEVKTAIESKGCRVQETLAEEMVMGASAGAAGTSVMNYAATRVGAQVVMDPEVANLQRQLQEADTRLRAREQSVREYTAWHQMLAARPDHERLKLRHDDWMFFFGK